MSAANKIKDLLPMTRRRALDELRKRDAVIADLGLKLEEAERAAAESANEARIMRREWESLSWGYDHERSALPEEYPLELRRWYKRTTGKELDLENPETYNEKVQWYKLQMAGDPLYAQLADKFSVREWVVERIGEQYLVPIYGCWNSFEEIDFDRLPERFVLKPTHASGMVCVIRNKAEVDMDDLKRQVDSWLGVNFAYCNGYELQYASIPPRIIAEEFMANDEDDLYDYKFWCFDGRVEYIQFLSNRRNGLKMSFYDREWSRLPFRYDHPSHDELIARPKRLDEMLRIAEALGEGFQHVRVDLYDISEGIRFGEMTFTSASGGQMWDPPEADAIIGQKWAVRHLKT